MIAALRLGLTSGLAAEFGRRVVPPEHRSGEQRGDLLQLELVAGAPAAAAPALPGGGGPAADRQPGGPAHGGPGGGAAPAGPRLVPGTAAARSPQPPAAGGGRAAAQRRTAGGAGRSPAGAQLGPPGVHRPGALGGPDPAPARPLACSQLPRNPDGGSQAPRRAGPATAQQAPPGQEQARRQFTAHHLLAAPDPQPGQPFRGDHHAGRLDRHRCPGGVLGHGAVHRTGGGLVDPGRRLSASRRASAG